METTKNGPRSSISILGIVVGIVTILFLSIVAGIIIILISIYYWKKPQLISDAQQGKSPKWWWRFIIPSTPFVEFGAIVCILLIFVGGIFLMFGCIVALTDPSSAGISPIISISIGLLLLIPGIILAVKVIKKESEDWRNRILNEPGRLKQPTYKKEGGKFWAIIIIPVIIVSSMAIYSFISQATQLPQMNASYTTFENNTTMTINYIPLELEQDQSMLLLSNIDVSLSDSAGAIVFNRVSLANFESGAYVHGFNFTDADRDGHLSLYDYFILDSVVYPEKDIMSPQLATLTLFIHNDQMIMQILVAT